MTDSTREHVRLTKTNVQGRRAGRALHIGRIQANSPVIIHFHGGDWLPEQAVSKVYSSATVIAIQAGSGSAVYEEAFRTPEKFEALLNEADAARRPVILTAFSAGYGAVRAILRHSENRIAAILLMDGLHTGYAPNSRDLESEPLEGFLAFAREASAGRKRFLITHSEVFPGTFASTTETADWLLSRLELKRKRVLRWGPVGMQQLSEARSGRLLIAGFAGNSAPDHLDHLHAMAGWLRRLRGL